LTSRTRGLPRVPYIPGLSEAAVERQPHRSTETIAESVPTLGAPLRCPPWSRARKTILSGCADDFSRSARRLEPDRAHGRPVQDGGQRHLGRTHRLRMIPQLRPGGTQAGTRPKGEGFLPEEFDGAQRLSGTWTREAPLGFEVDEILAQFLGGDQVWERSNCSESWRRQAQ